MILTEVIVRVASLTGLIVFSFLVCRKLGVRVYKGKATTGAIAIGIPVLIHTFVFNGLEKRFGWFGESDPNSEFLGKLVPEPVSGEQMQMGGGECCGGSMEEREVFKGQLDQGWHHRDESDPELQEVLPPRNILEQAEAAFVSEGAVRDTGDELEIDWDAIRLAMLEGAESTGGKVGKAMVAEMMLEADHFMENMDQTDAIAIAERAQEIWDRVTPNFPPHLITGTNAAVWRKSFEVQAAVERSIRADEKAFWGIDHQVISE